MRSGALETSEAIQPVQCNLLERFFISLIQLESGRD
jgi:hypothetical protein